VKVNNRKVRKFKGGGADMGDPGRAGERAARGYGSTAGPDRSKVSPQQEASHQRSIASAKASNQQKATSSNFFNPVTTGINIVGQLATKIPGIGYGIGLAKNLSTGFKNAKNLNTARKEDLLGGEMLTTPNMNRPYAPKKMGGDGDGRIGLCPDGSNPPCKSPITQIKTPVSKPNPFLSGFKSYDDGGEVIISANVDKDLL
jgi:hypothetical protein